MFTWGGWCGGKVAYGKGGGRQVVVVVFVITDEMHR